jgi:hypothetical protein
MDISEVNRTNPSEKRRRLGCRTRLCSRLFFRQIAEQYIGLVFLQGFLAYALNFKQVFGSFERAVGFAVFHNHFGLFDADARQCTGNGLRIGGVDIDRRSKNVKRRKAKINNIFFMVYTPK